MMKVTIVIIAAVFAIILACNGGGDGTPTEEPSTPTPEASPNLSPTVGSIEAMRLYLMDTGLDGRTGTLTDPIDCNELMNLEDVEGDFCIFDDASVYALGLVILFVADVESPDEDVWEIHMEPGASAWDIVDVDFVGTE